MSDMLRTQTEAATPELVEAAFSFVRSFAARGKPIRDGIPWTMDITEAVEEARAIISRLDQIKGEKP